MNKKINHQHPMLARLTFIIIIIVIFTVIIRLFGGSGSFIAPISEPELQTMVEQSIQKTFSADYYKFTNKSTLTLDTNERVFSILDGEKSLNDSHISGSILGTAVNIYRIGNQFYQQDPVDQSWHINENTTSESATHLISELNPESNFRFAKINQLTDLGNEKIDGKKTLKVQFKPTLSDNWIEQYFTEITYTLWLDKKHQYIVKSQITATSKEHAAGKLVIENSFSEFGKKINLTIPTEIMQ